MPAKVHSSTSSKSSALLGASSNYNTTVKGRHRGHGPSSSSSHNAARSGGRIPWTQDVIVPLLARRSYHLPGNTWWGDWCQWFGNNHIFFGICLHHKWHPLEWWERSLALTASISFGLVAIQVVYYYYTNPENAHYRDQVLWSYGDSTTIAVTRGMVWLWTVGGVFHSLFDMLVWNIMACACCQPGGRFGKNRLSTRCRDVGSYTLIPVILVLLAMAIYLVLLRASQEGDGQAEDNANNNNNNQQNGQNQGNNNNNNNYWWNGGGGATDDAVNGVDVNQIQGLESFSFLQGYAMEVALAWCVYFPLLGTILFSGCLGCGGRLPLLGGRPRDIQLVAQEASQPPQQQGTRSSNSGYFATHV